MDSLAAAQDACMIYVTVGSDAEARKIASALVREKHAACVNILGQATSIYTWKGAMEEAQEIVMICKTRRSHAKAAAARIKELHGYEVPCIAVYEMAAGFPPFLAWIEAETGIARPAP
jgi:periplasmic divalent cation tolerance protein